MEKSYDRSYRFGFRKQDSSQLRKRFSIPESLDSHHPLQSCSYSQVVGKLVSHYQFVSEKRVKGVEEAKTLKIEEPMDDL